MDTLRAIAIWHVGVFWVQHVSNKTAVEETEKKAMCDYPKFRSAARESLLNPSSYRRLERFLWIEGGERQVIA